MLDGTLAEILFDFVALMGFFILMPVVFEGWWGRMLKPVERAISVLPAIGFLVAMVGPMNDHANWAWMIASGVLIVGIKVYIERTPEVMPQTSQ